MSQMSIITNVATPLWGPGITTYNFNFYTADQDPTQSLTREQLEVRHFLVSGIVSTDVMISPVSSWLAFCFTLAVWFLNCRYTPPGILWPTVQPMHWHECPGRLFANCGGCAQIQRVYPCSMEKGTKVNVPLKLGANQDLSGISFQCMFRGRSRSNKVTLRIRSSVIQAGSQAAIDSIHSRHVTSPSHQWIQKNDTCRDCTR